MNLHAYVGRQAIFNRSLEVVGYELLYRDSFENRAKFADVEAASATTMLHACVELGLGDIAGALPMWVNVPQAFLIGELPLLLPRERTVIEVLETVEVTPQLLESLSALRRQGFQIALDDFVLTSEREPLVGVADIIKLDVLGLAHDEIESRFRTLRPRCKVLAAEKVATPEDYQFLSALGFDLFQGFFLERPVVTRSGRMPHNRAALLSLLGRLYDPRMNYREIEQLLSGEVGLAVRMLKLAGSAANARGGPVGSVAQAIARLGTAQVAGLVLLLVVAGFDDKPIELMREALVRAKMCEGLARLHGQPADQLFTAGLLSLLDAVFDQSMATILGELPVTDLIRDIILGRIQDRARMLYEVSLAQARGDLALVARSAIPAHVMFAVWFDSVNWANGIMNRLGQR